MRGELPKTVRLSRVVVYMMYRRRLLPHVKSNQSPSAPCGHSQTAFFFWARAHLISFQGIDCCRARKGGAEIKSRLKAAEIQAPHSRTDVTSEPRQEWKKKLKKCFNDSVVFMSNWSFINCVFFHASAFFPSFFLTPPRGARTAAEHQQNFFNSPDRNDDEKNETLFLSQMPRSKKTKLKITTSTAFLIVCAKELLSAPIICEWAAQH